MENHEGLRDCHPLQVRQSDQAKLEGRADRLTSIACIELLEDVVQMSLNGWCGEPEVLSEPLGGMSLCNPSKNLHFT